MNQSVFQRARHTMSGPGQAGNVLAATPDRCSPRSEIAVSRVRQLALVLCIVVVVSAAVDHFLADWLRIPKTGATYRRIGPESGPQVFLAGSSLLQSGISWEEVSKVIGRGIENWAVAGSSPTEWEHYQSVVTNSDMMIIGISVYDLNEYHLCESSANIVPITRTIQDLWKSRCSWQFSKRLLSEYALMYARELFPTAGRSDAVLVGFRRRLRELFKLSSVADDRAIINVTPNQPTLSFGEDVQKVSDWAQSRTLRRVALMRSHFQGMHAFNGPKKLAFLRMLKSAQRHGRVVVVVQPVTPVYVHEFLTPDVRRKFEETLTEARRDNPDVLFVRLDNVPALESNECYSDLVHRNSLGRRISTEVFLRELHQNLELQ